MLSMLILASNLCKGTNTNDWELQRTIASNIWSKLFCKYCLWGINNNWSFTRAPIIFGVHRKPPHFPRILRPLHPERVFCPTFQVVSSDENVTSNNINSGLSHSLWIFLLMLLTMLLFTHLPCRQRRLVRRQWGNEVWMVGVLGPTGDQSRV